MVTVSDLQKIYREAASRLGEFELLSKTELANGYCDADEELAEKLKTLPKDSYEIEKLESLRSAYFAALMLRYWYKIHEWMSNSSSLLTPMEEYVDWLSESLAIAFRYRSWRTEYKVVWGKHSHKVIGYKLDENGNKIPNPYYYVTDPNAPDKIFNRCIFSARGRAYQFANKQKRKGDNFKMSLDAMHDDEGDCATVYTNTFAEDEPITRPVTELVKELLRRGEVSEAIVVDNIAFGESFKINKKDKSEHFDTRYLTRCLNATDDGYFKRFSNVYLDGEAIPAIYIDKFKKMKNKKLHNCIEKVLQEIKQMPELLEFLQES